MLILPGVEFSTEYGHLLALFLSREISYTTWEETTKAVHAQGGVTVLAHPFQKSRPASSLLPLVPHLDGVEVWNSRANRKNPQPTPRQRRLPARPAWFPPPAAMPTFPRKWGAVP